MPKGIALIIGLNRVDPGKYNDWDGYLTPCESDADDMADIALSKGFEVKILLTEAATRQSVIDEMTIAANQLESGDIFAVYYSGHGSWLPDVNGDEDDEQDETWCLYDGEIMDDELLVRYANFAEGVRVVVISDSCHSGTVTKGDIVRSIKGGMPSPQFQTKAMPDSMVKGVYEQNKEFYDRIQAETSNIKEADVKASILLISGCQDWQTSRAGVRNSLFTSNLKIVWNEGKFKGNYATLHKKIKKIMPKFQTPNYYWVGKKDSKFEKQKALTI